MVAQGGGLAPDPGLKTKAPDRICWLLVIFNHLLLFAPVILGDSPRFLGQAKALATGQGFTLNGEYTLYLMPGYPALLAPFTFLPEKLTFIYLAQFLLSLVSCWLVYDAILYSTTPHLARIGLLLMGLNPFLIRACWKIMSENFGVFLAAVLVWLYSRLATPRGISQRKMMTLGALYGACSALIVLTVPSTACIATALAAVLLYKNRRTAKTCALMVLSGIVIGGSWSLYIYSVTGSFLPPPVPGIGNGLNMWIRTWSTRVFDIRVYHYRTDYLERLPSEVFESEVERERIIRAHRALAEKPRDTPIQSLRMAGETEYQEVFSEAARKRLSEQTLAERIRLIGMRALSQWLDYWHSTWFGGTTSSWGQWPLNYRIPFRAIYLIYFAIYIYLLVMGLRSKSPFAWAVLFGLAVFTLASAYLALGEERRNLPFLPFIFFLLAVPHIVDDRNSLESHGC